MRCWFSCCSCRAGRLSSRQCSPHCVAGKRRCQGLAEVVHDLAQKHLQSGLDLLSSPHCLQVQRDDPVRLRTQAEHQL